MSRHWTYYVAKSWQNFVTAFQIAISSASIVTFIWLNVYVCQEEPMVLLFWIFMGINAVIAAIAYFIKKFHKWTEKVLEENK